MSIRKMCAITFTIVSNIQGSKFNSSRWWKEKKNIEYRIHKNYENE